VGLEIRRDLAAPRNHVPAERISRPIPADLPHVARFARLVEAACKFSKLVVFVSVTGGRWQAMGAPHLAHIQHVSSAGCINDENPDGGP